MNNYLNARYWTYFLLLQIATVQLLSLFPNFVECYYATGIYPRLSGFMRFVFGGLPFSIGDVFYGSLMVLLLRFVYIVFRNRGSELKRYLWAVGKTLSILHLAFYLSWGMNYFRIPLASQLGIKSQTFTLTQLLYFTENLVLEVNSLQVQLNENKQTAVSMPYSQKELYDLALKGYQRASDSYPFLAYKNPSVKNSLFSKTLTYMGFAGYLNPFSGEAQVNDNTPLLGTAFTTCHEMAHQLGYAPEKEANFIGYLACISNENLYFQYAGKLKALKYLLSEISKRNGTSYTNICNQLHPGVLKNLNEATHFWKQYQNPLEPFFKKGYHTYLKANRQNKGIQGYNYMVGLLLNYKRAID